MFTSEGSFPTNISTNRSINRHWFSENKKQKSQTNYWICKQFLSSVCGWVDLLRLDFSSDSVFMCVSCSVQFLGENVSVWAWVRACVWVCVGVAEARGGRVFRKKTEQEEIEEGEVLSWGRVSFDPVQDRVSLLPKRWLSASSKELNPPPPS